MSPFTRPCGRARKLRWSSRWRLLRGCCFPASLPMQVEIRRADVCSLPIAPQDALMKIIAIEAMHRQAEHPNTGDFTIRSNLFHSGEQAMTQEQLRVVADYGDLCGEGPLWDSRSETLYWTDAV